MMMAAWRGRRAPPLQSPPKGRLGQNEAARRGEQLAEPEPALLVNAANDSDGRSESVSISLRSGKTPARTVEEDGEASGFGTVR